LGGGDCQWDVSFASSTTKLDVTVDYFENIRSDSIDIGPGGGSIGSDGLMPGCGEFAFCRITGFWELTSVPEPSSISVVATVGALLSLGLRHRKARLKNGAVLARLDRPASLPTTTPA
jgi:hypothetical protein